MSEPTGTQICRKCKVEKPLSDFPRNKAIVKGDHPGIDPMCKQCWKDGRKARQGVVAEAKEQGVAVPKRSRKAAQPAGEQEGSGAEEAPASSQFSSTDPTAPENTVPTVITEMIGEDPIQVVHIPSGDNLSKKNWYRGLIGPLGDVFKFFSDIFGRKPTQVFKFKNTYYFPLTDEEAGKTREHIK